MTRRSTPGASPPPTHQDFPQPATSNAASFLTPNVTRSLAEVWTNSPQEAEFIIEPVTEHRATSETASVDINYSYREHPPVVIDGVGAVLDIDDLLTGNLQALTSRTAERDYYDIDALLSTGRWAIHDLWAKLHFIRPNWSIARFAEVLSSADLGDPVEYRALGMTQGQIAAMVTRLKAHADALRRFDA